LIIRLTTLPVEYAPYDRVGRLAAVALEEISWEPDDHLHLPLPKDKRLCRLHDALIKNPGDNCSLEGWAKIVGASSRTLARLFLEEYGTSFINWRQQVRVLAALPMLGAGDQVINVAMELGYETPSAFTAMFRRVTGVLPSQYFS
jgi:AraC-like DNA-binding protein